MSEDLLNLNARVATVLDIATWLWIGSVLYITCCLAWLAIRICRRTAASIARALGTVRAAEADLASHHDLDAHLDATWQQLADETRKEEQQP